MAGQAGQSLGNNLNVDINFGGEPQRAVAARVLTSSQLQVFSSDGILFVLTLHSRPRGLIVQAIQTLMQLQMIPVIDQDLHVLSDCHRRRTQR